MFIADLHIHSYYSRATSRACNPEMLELWARRKGIALIGTGDFTHAIWREELAEKLVPAEDGLYRLKKEFCIEDEVANAVARPRFVLSGEISCIYKKNGRVRKVHNLILLLFLKFHSYYTKAHARASNYINFAPPFPRPTCPCGIKLANKEMKSRRTKLGAAAFHS